MEIEGHPTQDLIEELEQRGATRVAGTARGLDPDALPFLRERFGEEMGFWLFLPAESFETGVDEPLA